METIPVLQPDKDNSLSAATETASAEVIAASKTLKIQPLIRVNRWVNTTVPEIRLSGAWLEKFGFHPEHRVLVKMTAGMLVLTPLPPADPD